jgi:putative ABC transport system permease protein
MRIVGLVTDFLSPRGTLEMSRELLRDRWRDGTVIRVLVRVDPGARVDDVRASIAERLGRTHALRILSQRELMDHLGGEVRRAFTPIHALGGVFLLVVLIGMVDTLTANVVERTGELGVIRAVGVRRTAIVEMVLIEGLVLATLGLLLATLLGLAIGVLWVEQTFPALLGWTIELHVPWREFALFGLLSVVACVGAAGIAGRAAARLRPALAVRWE